MTRKTLVSYTIEELAMKTNCRMPPMNLKVIESKMSKLIRKEKKTRADSHRNYILSKSQKNSRCDN